MGSRKQSTQVHVSAETTRTSKKPIKKQYAEEDERLPLEEDCWAAARKSAEVKTKRTNRRHLEMEMVAALERHTSASAKKRAQ